MICTKKALFHTNIIANDSRSVTPDNSSCGENSENIIRSSMITNAGLLHYSDSTLHSGVDSTVNSIQNGGIIRGYSHPRSLSKSPHRPQRYRLRSSSRIRVQDPLKEEREREGSVSLSRGEEWDNRIERGWSTERGRRREICDIIDNGIIIDNNKNNHENFRMYRNRNENTVHTDTHTPNRNSDRRERESKNNSSPGFTHPHPLPLPQYRPVHSPLYMTPTASFASKLKILKPETSKRKPGIKAGSVSTSRTYDTNMNQNVYQNHNQRSHCFGSTYDTSQRTASGFITSNSALRDYREYGDDVREYEYELCVTDDSQYVQDSQYVHCDDTSEFFKASRDGRDINKEKEKERGRGREKERNKDFKNSSSMMRNRSGSTELIRGNSSIHVYNDDDNDNHYDYTISSYDNSDEKNFNIDKNDFQSTMNEENTNTDTNLNPKKDSKQENESENTGSVYGYSNNYIRSNSLKHNKFFENNYDDDDDDDNNHYDNDNDNDNGRNQFNRMNSKEENRHKDIHLVKQKKNVNSNVHEPPSLYRTDSGRIRDRSAGRSRSSHRRGEGIGRGREEAWRSNNNHNNNNSGEFSSQYGFLSWPTYGKGHGHGHGQDSGQSPGSSSSGGIYTMPNFKRYTDTVGKSRIK